MGVENDTLLIQFARAPVHGQVKTRMMPQLSARQACALHCQLVLHTCETLLLSALGHVQLAVAGDRAAGLFDQCRALGPLELVGQRGADLGERMYLAIASGLTAYRRVLLVGSDCPEIDGNYLRAARAALDRKPLVLGPATDGGYVLFGARQIQRELFEHIDWGTERVFAQTVAAMRQAQMQWETLAPLNDIDRPEDLATWRRCRPPGAGQ